ncbi:hypothetical protein OY20_25900 [Bacillus anthracis]|uniref:DUF3900 domain-containing protein n=1 Tax=Bacillus anthracis TaxID=1392 RepID=UPI000542BA72|nr:DUF3900 domain-containing protein [Bacillus anthracis]KHG59725.1 hypothetical protein OY20_25900 [Bacillus anthracis]
MDFEINYLSFYVVQVEGKGEAVDKRYKHFQTLDAEEYEDSSLKEFLDGELLKISKRKVERHAKTEQAPTKIGRFIVEEGHELDSNPHYNLFNRIRFAETKENFKDMSEPLVYTYLDTSAVRGGVFLIAQAKLRKYFDDPFVFVMKCDFEPKVASISDESTLIRNVEMAITTKNMKSIQYPYMPEEGMVEVGELKIHQASHARYFEDFLKFVEYERSMPEIMKTQVMEATAQIVEHAPEVELKLKADHISVKALLADFGDQIHIAKVDDRYVLMIEADTLTFEKGFSPIEFLKPDELQDVIERIENKQQYTYDPNGIE